MSGYVCLDASVLVKLLTYEEDSEAAASLMEEIVRKQQLVALPAFAWAEVGSVLRQKVKRGLLTAEEAEVAWDGFYSLKILHYLSDGEPGQAAWRIAVEEDLPTLYDAAYLAVAELLQNEGISCLFWTADKQLAERLGAKKDYIRYLGDYAREQG